MKPKKATYTDQTWHCGCRMFEDGLNMVWNKCPIHAAAPDLLEAANRLIASLPRGVEGLSRATSNAVGLLMNAIAKAEGREP